MKKMWNSTSSFKSNMIAALAVVGGAVIVNSHNASNPTLNIHPLLHTQSISNAFDDFWSTVATDKKVDGSGEQIVGISEIIALTKTTLGLPNKDIAEIFGITRQTLHNYANGGDLNQSLNKNTRQRALALRQIIGDIRVFFKHSPGAMAKNYTIEGKSLLNCLVSHDLNYDEIKFFASQLAARMESNQATFKADDKTLYSLTRSA
ncbi:hypothetical protein [Atlantibacter hermannii]|uniref:hypothetical protein n=1 Tax=Atlantibacter hermannii TaxID=565 RepID=UPI0022B775A7|nr:hypothetical protein [Atlantibacter hermannii]MCZ7836160.1 hypothetical protein [Atlantibacter hermannii]